MTQRGNLTRATAPATKPSQRLRDRQRAKTRPLAERRLSDFLPLGPAEQLLLDCCRVGEVAQVAEKRPEAPDATNRIRASFLRFLLLMLPFGRIVIIFPRASGALIADARGRAAAL